MVYQNLEFSTMPMGVFFRDNLFDTGLLLTEICN